jgi:hypothetical protein
MAIAHTCSCMVVVEILVMKLRQGPIDYRDCCVWLILDLGLVNFCWVHETNSAGITLF